MCRPPPIRRFACLSFRTKPEPVSQARFETWAENSNKIVEDYHAISKAVIAERTQNRLVIDAETCETLRVRLAALQRLGCRAPSEYWLAMTRCAPAVPITCTAVPL